MRLGLVVIGGAVFLMAAAVGAAWYLAQSEEAPTDFELCHAAGDGFQEAVDLGRTGRSPGDQRVYARPLRSPSTGRKVGRNVGVHTLVQAGGREGSGTYVADDTFRTAYGKITTHGHGIYSRLRGEGVAFTVTGGSRSYRRAGGTVTVVRARCAGRPGLRFTFDLDT